MKTKSLVLCGFTLTLLFGTGCRESNTSPVEQPALTGPVVFIPPGILKSPRGIAIDTAGFVWVSDTYNDRIVRFTPEGSTRVSLAGFTLPGGMGIDRSTNDILVIVNGNNIVRIDAATENPSIVTTVTSPTINVGAHFDVVSRQQGSHAVLVEELGDIDGTPNGDIYVSCFGTGNENHVLRVRNGATTAIAYSTQQPDDSLDRGTKYLAVDNFGTVYTAFVLPNSGQSHLVYPYVVTPGNVFSSHAFTGTVLSGGVRGAGIDPSGILYVADTRSRALEILSTTSERRIERLDIPPVAGMTEPAARDVAVAGDGSVFVAVIDLFDTANERGVILKYTRSDR